MAEVIVASKEPGEGGKSTEKTPAADQSKLIETLEGLTNTLTTFNGRLGAVEKAVGEKAPVVVPTPAPVDPNADKPWMNYGLPENIEEADNAQLVTAFTKMTTDVATKTERKLESARQEREDKALATEVNAAYVDLRENTPDFDDWLDEMATVIKAIPGLTNHPQIVLEQARKSDPEKAEKLNAKYHPPKKEEPKDEDEVGSPEKLFGGFTPTGGKTRRAANMSIADAANAALQETMPHLARGRS